MQRDDMSDGLHAHGSHELVKDDLAANNPYSSSSSHPLGLAGIGETEDLEMDSSNERES
jgi:hypothetical protein